MSEGNNTSVVAKFRAGTPIEDVVKEMNSRIKMSVETNHSLGVDIFGVIKIGPHMYKMVWNLKGGNEVKRYEGMVDSYPSITNLLIIN